MKTAIYIEDGLIQLVLTPENKFEKNAISSLIEKSFKAEILEGSFYGCQGGFIRHNEPVLSYATRRQMDDDRSLILKVETDEK